MENFVWESDDISLNKHSKKPEDVFFTTIFEAKNKQQRINGSLSAAKIGSLPSSSFWLGLYKGSYGVVSFFIIYF